MRYILSDIEGTTTSVSFVYDVLFPYFLKHLRQFMDEHGQVDFVKENLEMLKKTVLEEEKKDLSDEEAVEQLIFWTETDRKHTALKNLQGCVWEKGYQKGEIKGHIYPDVPPALEKWQKTGIQLGIYSSGSVIAQKLIFGFSDFGDLTKYFSHYFDTRIGHKRETQSYLNIQKTIHIAASEILFLSDVEAELDAAQEAGFQTIQLLREGTKACEKHQTASDFSKIDALYSI